MITTWRQKQEEKRREEKSNQKRGAENKGAETRKRIRENRYNNTDQKTYETEA